MSAPACDSCRATLQFFGTVGGTESGAQLWFCPRCERRTWWKNGKRASMAELRMLVERERPRLGSPRR